MLTIDVEATREGRRARKNGDEQDAFSREARRAYVAFQRPGIAKRAKVIAHQRTRRQVRQALRDREW